MSSFPLPSGLGLLAAIVLPLTLAPVQSKARDTRTFEAADGSYSFDYPADFALAHLFPDGTGEVTGVKASTPVNGDVLISLLGPRDAGELREVNEATRQAVTDAFTAAVAVRPSITLTSTTMTTLFGRPAVDMVFSNARPPFSKERPQLKRYVFTALGDKAYHVECVYRADKAEQFAPACDLAVSTAKLSGAAVEPTLGSPAAPKAEATVACTRLDLNRRAGLVSEMTSNLLMKDQSPEAIARMKAAHTALMAIDERAGTAPSARDCTDMDALLKTLK